MLKGMKQELKEHPDSIWDYAKMWGLFAVAGIAFILSVGWKLGVV